ncbi:uncharacterized protein PGTG_19129 [Puccinia graminis f. sp. tritici CRL 75-36-700-3]|uniref:Uncharacterized protein n=1 Tax=Puccinia graminis f. sp. tritici (strain CRL 75-36-700-3 / race SCCL) TaxID=418459 RepID=E3L9E4_PUCGT|nr:uncharacterized protein PGTG_19129 [Puccinia graminis f. sp. tritici CRL 75-36-700-3]EFP93169.2 hypothetical protein PGTG_19129 [Puccinia graminis f. sp. tritici CRL 75-36-700-3]
MTSPHPPRSYYSPTQSFDEDAPIRSFPDSDYGDTGSPHESVPDPIPAAIVAEGLNEGKTFGDRRDRLLASIPPLPFNGEPMAYSSDQDGEYELDDSTAASIPDTGPDHHPVVDESAIDLNGFHYALDTTNGIARDIGSPNLNESAVSHIDPSLQLPSGADDQGDIGTQLYLSVV